MMKLFNINNMQIIEFCCEQFNFIIPSRQIANRRDKFTKSDSQRTNLLTFINRYYCYVAYMSCLITNLDKYMLFVCVFFFFLLSFLVKSFSIVYFVVYCHYHLW